MMPRAAIKILAFVALWLTLVPVAASAQQTASLLADRVQVRGNQQLVAEGNVEVLYEGRRLTASQIIFDRESDKLTIMGPIRITEGDTVTILADSAEMDSKLANGILTSARMVLDQQLQLAAAEMTRVDGRYTQLYKTVASSCQVCIKNPVPVWQIRAERVVHDQQERQLYFDNATIQVMGVSVFYLPRLRLPDPTLKRSTGFLIPQLRTTSRLGTGIKVPYFIAIGDTQDVTITPYLSSLTKTLELRYRRALSNGRLQFSGALTSDAIIPGKMRGYIFGDGQFSYGRDYKLRFNIEATSDPSYLLDYGYSDKDRLISDIELDRTRRDSYLSAALIHFRSLRASEDNATLPTFVTEGLYQRRFAPGLFGGTAGYRLESHTHLRTSTTPTDANGDGIVDGRDVTRTSMRFDWQRSWLTQPGIEITALTEFNADFYTIGQDATSPGTVNRVTPFAAVEFRWPWSKTTASGVAHVIEPTVQFVFSDDIGPTVPNEDSTRVEFDEGNLFAFSRFPGSDKYERGLRASLGLTWTRFDPTGWSMSLTVGRIVRKSDLGQFNAGSGLEGQTSNWLTAVQVKIDPTLTLTNRSLFDDRLGFSRSETRVNYQNNGLSVGSSYVWLKAEVGVSPTTRSEWSVDGSYLFADNWTGRFDWRYDLVSRNAASAGVGLVYLTECVALDLSLSRRFTSSTSVTPETKFSLKVGVAGVGATRRAKPGKGSCYG